MACGDVLSLEDLQTAKKHQIFEAEVITGKAGGVSTGADIDYATNQVTGQIQKTMPAILRDIGYTPASFDFTTGGTLTATDRDKAVFDPVSKAWYTWLGLLPKVVPAGANPVGDSDWKPWTDPTLRGDLLLDDGVSNIHFKPSLLSGAVNKALTEFIYDQIIDVTWWAPAGFLPDWNAQTQVGNDYTSVVQAAINAYALLGNKRQGGKRAIKLPIGHFKLSSVTNPGDMGFGIDFIGAGEHATVIWSDPSDPNPTVTDRAGLTNFRNMSCFGSLSESGASTQRKQVFYRGKLSSNLADVDVSFDNCRLGYADQFAEIYGRGCTFRNCHFVYCNYLMMIVASPDTIFTGGTNDKTTTGFRHYHILNSRADVISKLVGISGTAAQKDHIHGIQIVGSDFAACDRLIEATDATLRGAELAGNRSVDSFAGGVVTAKAVSNCLDTANIWRNLHDESVLPASNADCIAWVWDISGAAAGLSILGTNVSNLRSGVVRTGAASTNVQIKNGTFPQFATFNGGDANHWVYNSPANCDGLQIEGNQFSTSTVSGTYKLYDDAVQTSNKTRVRDNTAPFVWADSRLRYTPALLVANAPTASTPSYAHGRISEITQTHVTVDIMLGVDPSETTGDLGISLPPAFPAIAENASISGGYSGGGAVNQAAGFSGTTIPFAPLRVNPVTQQAEVWLASGPSGTRATAALTTGVASLFCSVRYRYA